mgnify:CR=1 FL=1
MSEWQPIETAPKDVKDAAIPVLLWSPSTHTYPLFGRYWTQLDQWEEDCGATECNPTHWMPLPAPPVQP